MTNTIAPKRGPITVATPPNITININSPDLDQSIISGDMKVVKLGTVPDDKFLKTLLTTKVYNAKYSLSNNYDYPKLHITKSEIKYINNRYRRAMNLFGYGNDY